MKIVEAILEGKTKQHEVFRDNGLGLNADRTLDCLVTHLRYYLEVSYYDAELFTVWDPVRLLCALSFGLLWQLDEYPGLYPIAWPPPMCSDTMCAQVLNIELAPEKIRALLWATSDRLLSFLPRELRERREPRGWDDRRPPGLRRIEISRPKDDDQKAELTDPVAGLGISGHWELIEPFYFRSNKWMANISKEFRTTLLDSEFKFNEQSLAARKECLDVVGRDWVIQGFLRKKLDSLYKRIPWFRFLILSLKWLNNNFRPILIIAINIVIVVFIKERGEIDPTFSNALLERAGCDDAVSYDPAAKCELQNEVTSAIRVMGVLAMVMSGVNLYSYVEEHGMLLVLRDRVRDHKQWIRIREQDWMWSKPNKRTGERSPNLFGVVSLLKSTSFRSWKLYIAAFNTVRRKPLVIYLITIF
eukprot:SAG31_NODE_8719_length_1400_cov_0.829362_1_plen_415_part_01